MDPAALSIQCLVKIHPGPVYALRGIDLEIPEGMFGLLGPNGAGKSTFMNIGAAIVEPTASRYLLVWSHQPRPSLSTTLPNRFSRTSWSGIARAAG